MAVPKRKTSKSARNQRRSHHAKKAVSLVKCAQCNSIILPHTACDTCGSYRGKQIVSIEREEKRKKTKLELRAQRRKEKEESKQEAAAPAEKTEKKASAKKAAPKKKGSNKKTKTTK
ncbi:50S ribosomal protein L32 [Patescibacteria group bacterium]